MKDNLKKTRFFRFKPPVVLLILLVLTSSLLQAQVSHSAAYTIQYDPSVAAIVAQVNKTTLYNYVSALSGQKAVTIGGTSYTLRTRNTNSGIPAQKATQYIYQYLLGLPGMDSVSYADWQVIGSASRNVVGVLTGATHPDEIVLLTAHLDDMPNGSTAPGADDNASGAAALMYAARLLSQHSFDRTIRFVFFTGEEQWLLGSGIYAKAARDAGENIVAVLNMDMIGWESDGEPIMRIHTRPASTGTKDLEIADLFVGVVDTYAINLTPIITSYGMGESDHGSFWDQDYPAVCIIEDDGDGDSLGDFTPYYHTTSDTIDKLNMPFFTNIAAATIGSAAHLAFINDGALPSTGTPTRTAIPSSTPIWLVTPTKIATPLPGTVLIVRPVLAPTPGNLCATGWLKIALGGFKDTNLYLTTNVTHASDANNAGKWTPVIPKTGRYKLEAYISHHGSLKWACPSVTVTRNTSRARYIVQSSTGKTAVVLDQSSYDNAWANLGQFKFAAGKSGYISLKEFTGEADASRLLVYNVLRLTWIGP